MSVQDSMRQFKAGVFQALSHPTRIFIIETIGRREMTVGQLSESLGISQPNASQHLSVLRSKLIVQTRKDGNQIYYRLRDPFLIDVLKKMRQYFLTHMAEVMSMLNEEAESDLTGEVTGENCHGGKPG